MTAVADLYRQTKLAQARAEQHGCVDTAVALAGIAAMMVTEHDVDAGVIGEFVALAGAQAALTSYARL